MGRKNAAQTPSLGLEAVEEVARPDKLGGEKAQSQSNDHPARAGGKDHGHADQEQGEPA